MAARRREGAGSVALIGASMGGAVAVAAAARLHPAAMVNLSGERDTATLTPGIRIDAGEEARAVTAPSLWVVARNDHYTPVPDMRLTARRARSRVKRLIVLPTAQGHGIGMLLGNERPWSPLAAQVAAFVRRYRR
jgi:dienelactone hydrolase